MTVETVDALSATHWVLSSEFRNDPRIQGTAIIDAVLPNAGTFT
ncbi:hypothetical protein ADILRU_2164 [Leifsonia rubra CMS 76R]|nr:hypothetical protein ADILRU_2164 [Leifsonia rubra CMS 76R]